MITVCQTVSAQLMTQLYLHRLSEGKYHNTQMFTKAAFRKKMFMSRCDNKNLGLSDLCTFKRGQKSLDPPIWGNNVIREETEGKGRPNNQLPKHIKEAVNSNQRCTLEFERIYTLD